METTINNFEDLQNLINNNPLHILTENEGWETLFPHTRIFLDLPDQELPEGFDYYPYSLHLYQGNEELLDDITYNIDTLNLLNLGDDAFYDYMPSRIRCLIKGFDLLQDSNYKKQISKLASQLLNKIKEASEYWDDQEFENEYVDLFTEIIESYI